MFPKNIYCGILCERCCVDKEYIRIEKVFGDANENGVADNAIDMLKLDISRLGGVLEDNNILEDLQQYFITKKEQLPKLSGSPDDNRKRLNAANNCFIINELIVILNKCFNNYSGFLQNNPNELFPVDTFKNYFKKFLNVCVFMIKESLAEYRTVEKNNEYDILIVELNQNNPFKIDVEAEEYNVKDTTELRNKIGDLFNITFGKLIRYRLQKDFNKDDLEISDEDIKTFDGLTL